MILMEAEGDYSDEDWIPLISNFDNNDDLKYDGQFESGEDLIRSLAEEEINVEDPDNTLRSMNERGGFDTMEDYPSGQIFYEEAKTGAEVLLKYNPPKDHDGFAEGHLKFHAGVKGPAIGRTWAQMVEENGTEYMTVPAGSGGGVGDTVCWLHIPENYDQRKLDDTIDAVVDLARNVERLDNELVGTVEDFEYLETQ